MTRFLKAALGCGLALAAAAPVFANDSTAQIGIGGLVLARNGDIEMAKEDLYLSLKEVKVDYVFHNNSDKDIESVVAFPLPDITFDPEMNSALPVGASDNFLGFELKIDGQSLKPDLDQRAFALNIDVTDILKKHGIPLYGYDERVEGVLKGLPADVVQDLIARDIVYSYDDSLSANWTLRSAYWWKAKFPAGKDVQVSHRYQPAIGGSSTVSFFREGKLQQDQDEFLKAYCIDGDFEKSLQKLQNAEGFVPYYESYLDYVLTTGGNWAGGRIKDFRLVVDKGDEKNLVSFCGEGVKKIGPTTFEMKAKDFYPDKDISILVLTPQG